MSEENYAIFDNQGMLIEKGKNYSDEMSGALNDILLKSKQIISDKDNSDEVLTSIDIAFEKGNITTVINNEKNTVLCLVKEKNKE